MVALQSLQSKLDYQVRPEGAQPAVVKDVALVDLAHQGTAEARRLGLVISVLVEAQTTVGVKLAQVHYDRGVRLVNKLGRVQDPATEYRHSERARKVGC